MSENNQDIIEKIGAIPLPFTICFASKTLSLENLLSEEEKKYRNRPYSIKSFSGKKGMLGLGGIDISPVTIEDEGMGITIQDSTAAEQMAEILSSADIALQGIAGAALLSVDSIAALSSGSIIALDRDIQYPAWVEIEKTGYTLCFGETMDIDGRLGLRITSMDGGYYQKAKKKNHLRGEAVLGSMVIAPESLAQIGEGTILGFDKPSAPHFFRFSDGTELAGILQCFSKEELSSNPGLVNEIPNIDSEVVLTFQVTSINTPEKRQEQESTGKTEYGKDIFPVDAFFSAITKDRVAALLKSLDRACAVWLLKSADPVLVYEILRALCLDLGKEEGGRFLRSFVRCRPGVTPKIVAYSLVQSFYRLLDKAEQVSVREHGQVTGEFSLPSEDPVKRAAYSLSRFSDQEQQVFLQWLETTDEETHNAVREYLFVFPDLIHLSDKNLQKLMREIDSNIFTLALSGNEEYLPKLTKKFKQNMSQRFCQVFEDEMSYLKDVSEDDIYNARDTIIRVLARMEANGSIVI